MLRNKALVWVTIILIFPTIAFSKITKGPYVMHPTQTSMTVMWESDISEEAILKYGESNNLTNSLKVKPLDSRQNLFLYSVTIKDLKPQSKYYYRIVMSDSTTDIAYFTTAPTKDSPIKFVAIGDSRSDHKVYHEISELIRKISPDFIISMGDLVPNGGKFEQWGPNYFQPSADLIDHVPLISTVGDHDADYDDAENFNYFFRFSKDNEKLWFSFDYGLAHFVSLDYRGYKDSAMIAWFKKDMAQSNAKWKFVYLHRPSYNLGGHRSKWGDEVWPALYRKYKVDIVFAGHSHLYERFYPMRPSNMPDAWPVTYITTGGAGAELYSAVKHENLAVTESVNHLLSITLSSDTLKLIAYRPDMSVLDSFRIVKDNSGGYAKEYMDLIKPQEVLDAYKIFANELLLKFHQLPTETKPAVQPISFKSRGVDEDIPFSIVLSDKSAEYYYIEPVNGVLKKGGRFEGEIKLYSKKPYKIDNIYFDPPVMLNVKYRTKNGPGTAIGRRCRFYPPAKN